MISVKNLTKIYKVPQKDKGLAGIFKNIFARRYKEKTALNDISFEVESGELVGLIGPNGAGKTTTMKILSGILYPTSGKACVLGSNPFEKKPEFLKQISFVMGQRNQLIWDLPAVDSFNLNKEIYEINTDDFNKRLDELTSLLNCKQVVNQPVKTLSLGERMKMELIAAVLHKPKILFLDEPTIGLDVVAQKIVRDFIKEYKHIYHATIILTSHYMEDVKQLASRVIVINLGKIIYDGSLQELIQKYTKEKTVTVVLNEEIDKKTLGKIENVIEYDYPRFIFKVKKEDIAEKVAYISKNLNYSDINIEEEKIEDIIRKIFSKSK